MKNFENIILKVLKCVRTHPEELLVKKNMIFAFFGGKDAFWDHMMKMKNVENIILKILKRVRTHDPEELLAFKTAFLPFLKTRMHFCII